MAIIAPMPRSCCRRIAEGSLGRGDLGIQPGHARIEPTQVSPDSTLQALKWIATEDREPGMITFHIREIAKQRGITEEALREETRQKEERDNRR